MVNEPIDTDDRSRSVGAEEYSDFISQIELRNIWLSSAVMRNYSGPSVPEDVQLSIEDQAKFDLIESGFICTQFYHALASFGGNDAFQIDFELKLQFDSSQVLTGPLFEIFSEVNLPLNAWPYFREFVASSVGRMGWQPFTLPALKRGVRTRPQDRATQVRGTPNSSSTGRNRSANKKNGPTK